MSLKRFATVIIIALLSMTSITLCATETQQATTPKMSKQVESAINQLDTKRIINLIKKGANIHAKNNFGLDAISFSASKGDIEMMKILLSNGANLSNRDVFGRDILSVAISNGKRNIIKYLLEDQGVLPSLGNLAEVARTDCKHYPNNTQFETFIYLVDNGARLDTTSEKLKKYAVIGANEKIINYLASKQMKFNAASLQFAIWFKNDNIVQLLVDSYKVNIQSEKIQNQWFHPFHHAARHSSPKMLDYLIQHGAKIDAPDHQGKTPITEAFEGLKIDNIRILMNQGAKIEQLHLNPKYLIQYSLEDWHYLKSIGINFNCKDKNNANMFHLLTSIKSDSQLIEKFNFLIQNMDKNLINQRDKDNAKPLFYCIVPPDQTILELLINNGAELNTSILWNDMTPLMFLILQKATPQIELVLKKGADLSLRDFKGRTALDYVMLLKPSSDRDRILELIKNPPQVDSPRK